MIVQSTESRIVSLLVVMLCIFIVVTGCGGFKHKSEAQSEGTYRDTNLNDSTLTIFDVAKTGNLDLMKSIVESGVDVRTLGANKVTALHVASEIGHLEMVKYLLGNGAKVNAMDYQSNPAVSQEPECPTSLHRAALYGHLKVVDVLIENGANINSSSDYTGREDTALFCASSNGQVGMVKHLIAHGASIQSPTRNDHCAIHAAAKNGHMHVIRTLVSAGASSDFRDRSGRTPLHYAAEGGYENIVTFLIENGSDLLIEYELIAEQSLLHAASAGGLRGFAKLLLSRGYNVNAIGRYRYEDTTPLHNAARNGRTKLVEFLISKGANVDAVGKLGDTPLLLALENGHRKTVRLLIDRGADQTVRNRDGATLLHSAAAGGLKEMVEHLLRDGYDANSRDRHGRTPLHYAAESGKPGVALFLLNKGAFIDARTHTGTTPLVLAVQNGHPDVASLLVVRGANVNSSVHTKKNTTLYCDTESAIYLAAKNTDLELVSLLLKKGAYINSGVHSGCTPLLGAILGGKTDIAKFLVDQGSDIQVMGKSALYQAIKGYQIGVIKNLLSAGADLRVGDGNPLLADAIDRNQTDVAKLLVLAGADVGEYAHGAKIFDKFGGGILPLHLAAKSENEDLVRFLIEKGATYKPNELLKYAADGGLEKTVELAIAQGADINSKDHHGWTPLHYAARSGNVNVAELLIANGSRVEVTAGTEELTPLHLAASNNNEEAISLLVANGANIHATCKDNRDTPLHKAAQKGFADAVKILVDNEADVDLKNKYSRSTLEKALWSGHSGANYRATVKVLLDKTRCFHTPCGYELIKKKHKRRDRDILSLLVAKAIEVNLKTGEELSPMLPFAAAWTDRETVSLLLSKGANTDTTAHKGRTALHEAAENGTVDIVTLLIEEGMDACTLDEYGWSPYAISVNQRNHRVSSYLKSIGGDKCANVRAPPLFSNSSAPKEREDLPPLKSAIDNGDLKEIKKLLTSGVDTNEKDYWGYTPLFGAAWKGNVPIATLLIEGGADVNAESGSGSTPIFTAVRQGNAELISLLLAKGASIKHLDSDSRSPLSIAAEKGDKNMSAFLIEKGADVNQSNKKDQSPLFLAAKSGHIEVVELLLENGARVGHISLHSMIHFDDVMQVLIEKGAKLNTKDAYGNTPLYLAIRRGQIATANLLIERGADVCAENKDKKTALHVAVQYGPQKEIIKRLLAAGVDVNAADKYNETPLHYALREDVAEIVKLLLEHGANPNTKVTVRGRATKRTTLQYAIDSGQIALLDLLISHGADLGLAWNEYGSHPVYYAIKERKYDVAKYLVSIGAPIDGIFGGSFSPLFIATERGQMDIVSILIEKGADISVRDMYGATLLHEAARAGSAEIASLLLDAGLNVDASDKKGRTPLSIMINSDIRGGNELVDLLLENGASAENIAFDYEGQAKSCRVQKNQQGEKYCPTIMKVESDNNQKCFRCGSKAVVSYKGKKEMQIAKTEMVVCCECGMVQPLKGDKLDTQSNHSWRKGMKCPTDGVAGEFIDHAATGR
ncbi:MAG: hypothetical protein GY847_19765 [Proteobacteria bacterium]|nr:hypothetical protein [Pseudomonadota bacterium]